MSRQSRNPGTPGNARKSSKKGKRRANDAPRQPRLASGYKLSRYPWDPECGQYTNEVRDQ
jgi:hypothetical protein